MKDSQNYSKSNDYGKFIMTRYDHYYETVNNKGMFYLTFNTFFLAGWFTLLNIESSVLLTKENIALIMIFALGKIFVLCGIICGICSLFHSLKAVNPFLKSELDNKSLLFFFSVAKRKQETYIRKLLSVTEQEMNKDIAKQIHILAEGLTGKFSQLNIASQYILNQIYCMIIYLIFFLVDKVIIKNFFS